MCSFLIKKDNISKTFLSAINNKIHGEISFSDISFTPFKNFPNASLKFSDLSLKESKDSLFNSSNPPVLEIEDAYVSVNIVDLFSSQINASAIIIEGGSLNVIVYPDSQTNLEKALKKTSGDKEIFQQKPAKPDSLISQMQEITEEPSGLSLQIDKLEIINLELSAENHLKKNKMLLKINELQSEFSLQRKPDYLLNKS